jgi:CelD/BcsL family acetyltransferase involved in cellulose biosynthesis
MHFKGKVMPQESSGLRCELVTDFSRLQLLAPAWERLNSENCGSAFQSWNWASAFWKAHGHEFTLCSPVIFAGDSVVGIFPLMIRNGIVRLLGEPYADYNGPLCLPQQALPVLNAALSALLDAPFRWTESVFNNLPEDSPLIQCLALPEWPMRGHSQVVFQYSCPAARDNGSNIFERLARKESLRRHENRLRRQGSLCFRHIEDRQEIQGHLYEFFAQLATRQVLSGGRAKFLDAASRAMMRALVEELDPVHELRFSALELDGRAIAYHFGLQRAGKFIWYAPSFDANYWNDSPGEVLLRNLFQYVQKEKLSEFDFTIGDEAYKDRFANHVRKTWSAYFYRFPRQPRIYVRRAGRSVRDIARRNRQATEIARWVKRTVNRGVELLRQPVATLRSAAIVLGKVCVWQEEVVCRRMRTARGAEGARVRRAGLRDLAQLKIDNAIGWGTLQALRRRIRQGEVLYIVSFPAAEYLFWLRESSDAGAHDSDARIMFEAGPLVGKGEQSPAEALAEMLCYRQSSTQVCLEVPRSMAMDEALHRVGYAIQSRCLHISVLGRSICRLPQPATCLLKEDECERRPSRLRI